MAHSVLPTLRVFWQHIRRHLALTLTAVLALVVAHVLGVFAPLLVKEFFDALVADGGGAAVANAAIGVLLWLFALECVRFVLFRVSGFASSLSQPLIMADLELTAFTNILEHSYRFHTNEFTGALVRKAKRFSDAFLRMSDQLMYAVLQLAIGLAGLLIIFATRSMLLALLLAVWSLLFIVINYVVARWKLKYDEVRAVRDSEAMGALSDAVANMATIQQFATQPYEATRLRGMLGRWRKAQTKSWYIGSLNEGVQALFMLVLQFSILYLALTMYVAGTLTIGDIALVQLALFSLFGMLWDFGHVIRRLHESFADAQEMIDILQTPFEVCDAPGAKKLTVRRGDVAMLGVRFSYHGKRPLLKNFTLHMQAGEKVAFVGPSGAGKSTITKLVLRAYDVQGGTIRIDGQDIARVTQESLRKAVSLVPQDPLLFHRSLMENIRYGKRSASDAEVRAAAKQAHCHEFISRLPQGYATTVGERGVKLSGGERQRVAIARAILKNAPILILDEATSSLDSESEALIQDALRELMRDKTVMVIAHRLSTIMLMDRIVVIERGAVSESGTHAELLAKNGTYSRLWRIQAGGFLP